MKQASLKLVTLITLLIVAGLSDLANAQKSKPQESIETMTRPTKWSI